MSLGYTGFSSNCDGKMTESDGQIKNVHGIGSGVTKNWIAVEGSHSTSYAQSSLILSQQDSTIDSSEHSQDNLKIASSAPRGPQTFEDRNVFAIYVSYYIKIKLTLSGMGGEVSLKLPFILGHVDDDIDMRKNDIPKISDCKRSRTPTEIVEEECRHDEIGVIEMQDNIDGSCSEDANQCDKIQLEEQLRFAHINDNSSNIVIKNDTDDDYDEEEPANESCHNVITAQIHHESQQNPCNEQQVTEC